VETESDLDMNSAVPIFQIRTASSVPLLVQAAAADAAPVPDTTDTDPVDSPHQPGEMGDVGLMTSV
jgi:hypothetical protein